VCDCCTLQDGAEAADDLLEDVFRVPVEKALNPLHAVQFVTMIRRLSRSLRAKAGPIEQEVSEKAKELVDANWPELSASARDNKLQEVSDLMEGAAEREMPLIYSVFDANASQIVGATRKRVAEKFDLSISASLTDRDQTTSDNLRDTNTLFVRNNYLQVSSTLSEKARDIVASGLEKGFGREDISADLIEAMGSAKRPDGYWNMIATVFSNRARNFTQIHAFQEAEILAYIWESVVDEVTSDQCRFLHGREFSIETVAKRIERVQAAEDPEDILNIMPWIRKGRNDDGDLSLYYKVGEKRHEVCVIDETGEGESDKIGKYSNGMATEALAKAGLSLPPIHGSCRSTVIPAG